MREWCSMLVAASVLCFRDALHQNTSHLLTDLTLKCAASLRVTEADVMYTAHVHDLNSQYNITVSAVQNKGGLLRFGHPNVNMAKVEQTMMRAMLKHLVGGIQRASLIEVCWPSSAHGFRVYVAFLASTKRAMAWDVLSV